MVSPRSPWFDAVTFIIMFMNMVDDPVPILFQ